MISLRSTELLRAYFRACYAARCADSTALTPKIAAGDAWHTLSRRTQRAILHRNRVRRERLDSGRRR